MAPYWNKTIYAIAIAFAMVLAIAIIFQEVCTIHAIRELELFVAAVHPIDRGYQSVGLPGDFNGYRDSQFSRNRTCGKWLSKANC